MLQLGEPLLCKCCKSGRHLFTVVYHDTLCGEEPHHVHHVHYVPHAGMLSASEVQFDVS